MRRVRPLLVVAALLALVLGGTVQAKAAASNESTAHARANATLFAMGQAGAELLRIDVRAGTVEVVGLTAVAPQNLALAIEPGWRAAFTIAHTQDPTLAHLATVDLASGAITMIGANPLGQNLYIMGMTTSRNGVLYAAGDFTTSPTLSPTFNSLYTIDKNTGLAARVGSFGVGSARMDFIMSLSFDPSGRLFGASQRAIYQIDPTTGAATKVTNIVGATKVMGLAFDQQGRLFASDFISTGSTIYTVDLATGQFTPLIHTGVANVHNIAF